MTRPRRRGTVPSTRPPHSAKPAPPPAIPNPARRTIPPTARVAHIVDQAEASLLDLVDSLLNQGVVLNADVILALADVDLIYVRLSTLLVAADRLMPRD